MNKFTWESVTCGAILGFALSKLWTLSRTKKVQMDGLFFSPKKLICGTGCNINNHQKSSIPCNNCSLNHLISVLNKSKHHLDICMYLITSHNLSNTIIQLFRKGVRVRIILDKQMMEEAHGAQVIAFRKAYIPIKAIATANIMHNKFAIIDGEVVVSGSLNWTRQGLCGNYENVIILGNKDVAKKFTAYFQFLWFTDEPLCC